MCGHFASHSPPVPHMATPTASFDRLLMGEPSPMYRQAAHVCDCPKNLNRLSKLFTPLFIDYLIYSGKIKPGKSIENGFLFTITGHLRERE